MLRSLNYIQCGNNYRNNFQRLFFTYKLSYSYFNSDKIYSGISVRCERTIILNKYILMNFNDYLKILSYKNFGRNKLNCKLSKCNFY